MSDAVSRDLRYAEPDNPYLTDPDTEFTPPEQLDEQTAHEQIDQLRAAIREHDYRYYTQADPLIADRTYDALFDRLQTLEEAFDAVEPDSPTQRVGGETIDELATVDHVTPMLSIDQSADAEAVRAFDERMREAVESPEYVCEPKFDGLSVELVYEDGQFVRAATRGDGREGDDVTAQVRTIRSVPGRLAGDPPAFLAVRGEIYMPRDGFTEYNRERMERGEEPFANPRNAAAGTLRQLDVSVVAERPLAVFAYDVLGWAEAVPDDPAEATDGDRPATHAAETEALASFGFPVPDRRLVTDSIEEAIEFRNDLQAERDDLSYEIDGVVIKLNDRAACDRLGTTSRAYRWAFAYKFPARTEQTVVRDVLVQVGRTGRLTPVALLDPVDVGGVTVARASLHNPDQIAELGVGIGDRVRVKRAGDVIPQVTEVIDHETDEPFSFPETCPACDRPIERDGPLAYCPGGLACPAQTKRTIEYYASREGLDIEGLGEQRIAQLREAELLETLPDLYRLPKRRLSLAALEGWGAQSVSNLIEEIETATEPELPAFLTALGIREVGPATARGLAQQFGTFEAIRAADEAELQAVDDVGPAVAAAICGFFENPDNAAVVDELLEYVTPQSYEVETGDALEGLRFVFTGSLSVPRSTASELVERHGASVTGSVSGVTDYLVAGENPGDRKRREADDEDVPILSEAEFADLLADHGIDWPPEDD